MAWTALCATCAVEVGDDGWCEGHVEDGREHRRWATRLPDEWPTVTRLWWVATGEVRADPAWLRTVRDELPGAVRRALP